MTDVVENVSASATPRRFMPGALLRKIDWLGEKYFAAANADPIVLCHLLEADWPRLHLIALALAHMQKELSPQIAQFLACAPEREVLDSALGRRPAGLCRALHHLVRAIEEPEYYLRLAKLFEDAVCAKYLRHMRIIESSTINLLYEAPPDFRRPLTLLAHHGISSLDRLAVGLRFLASRGASPGFEVLVSELSSLDDANEIIAKLGRFLDSVPLPDVLPPDRIRCAKRMDEVKEIRVLARMWKDCLANYVDDVNSGECALYFWDDVDFQAACLVKRRGRLGWFLDEVNGPANIDLEQHQIDEIFESFEKAGIPLLSIIEAIECILSGQVTQRSRRRRRLRGDASDDLDELLD